MLLEEDFFSGPSAKAGSVIEAIARFDKVVKGQITEEQQAERLKYDEEIEEALENDKNRQLAALDNSGVELP